MMEGRGLLRQKPLVGVPPRRIHVGSLELQACAEQPQAEGARVKALCGQSCGLLKAISRGREGEQKSSIVESDVVVAAGQGAGCVGLVSLFYQKMQGSMRGGDFLSNCASVQRKWFVSWAWASSHMGRLGSSTASSQAGRACASIHFHSEVAHDGLNLFGRHSCMSALTGNFSDHEWNVSNDCMSTETGCTFQKPVKRLGRQKSCRQCTSSDAHSASLRHGGLMLPYLAGCSAQGSLEKPWSCQTLAIASFL